MHRNLLPGFKAGDGIPPNVREVGCTGRVIMAEHPALVIVVRDDGTEPDGRRVAEQLLQRFLAHFIAAVQPVPERYVCSAEYNRPILRSSSLTGSADISSEQDAQDPMNRLDVSLVHHGHHLVRRVPGIIGLVKVGVLIALLIPNRFHKTVQRGAPPVRSRSAQVSEHASRVKWIVSGIAE